MWSAAQFTCPFCMHSPAKIRQFPQCIALNLSICSTGMQEYTSSTRTRRGGSCLKDIYKTFLIYRTCMRRAPAKPVRACTLRKWRPVSHVTFEAPLRPSHFSLHSSHSTLHTSHSTLHTSLFTVHTSHFSLLIAFFTLHTSHCTLHAPHFTLHSAHSTLHLIWALLTLSQLISSHLISSHMSSKLSWITSQYYY